MFLHGQCVERAAISSIGGSNLEAVNGRARHRFSLPKTIPNHGAALVHDILEKLGQLVLVFV